MTDPFAILGLERGDLLAAAGCLHRYRQPHMVALVARLSEAEHRAAQAAASLGEAGRGLGQTNSPNPIPSATRPPTEPHNTEGA